MQLWSSSSFALPRAPTRAMARARSANEQLCNHLLDQKKVLPLPTWVTTEIANIAWTCGWLDSQNLPKDVPRFFLALSISFVKPKSLFVNCEYQSHPDQSAVQLSHAPLNSSHPLLLFSLYIKNDLLILSMTLITHLGTFMAIRKCTGMSDKTNRTMAAGKPSNQKADPLSSQDMATDHTCTIFYWRLLTQISAREF